MFALGWRPGSRRLVVLDCRVFLINVGQSRQHIRLVRTSCIALLGSECCSARAPRWIPDLALIRSLHVAACPSPVCASNTLQHNVKPSHAAEFEQQDPTLCWHCATSTGQKRSSLYACTNLHSSPSPLPLQDCDGVLVDTERDGHRVTFNKAFASKGACTISKHILATGAHNGAGLDHEWDVELYGKLLEIGGGKERMTKYFLVTLLTAPRTNLHVWSTYQFDRITRIGSPSRASQTLKSARLLLQSSTASKPTCLWTLLKAEPCRCDQASNDSLVRDHHSVLPTLPISDSHQTQKY